MFQKIPLKLYFMKYSARKVLQCILTLKKALKFRNIHRNTPVVLIKLPTVRPATLLKRGSDTGVSLSILRKYCQIEHLFWRTSANGSFWSQKNQKWNLRKQMFCKKGVHKYLIKLYWEEIYEFSIIF